MFSYTEWQPRLKIVLIVALFWISLATSAQIQPIYVLKEIDDDNIIVVTEDGDQLLLEKWSMRLSPLLFEGKAFYAKISPMWVTIYFDDRDPIKWSIEEHLGNIYSEKKSKPEASGSYYGVGSDHWIQRVIDGGRYILLEDGSLWEVLPIDIITSALWLPISDIVVTTGGDIYPYRLINTDDGEVVEAKYIGQK